MKNIDNIKDHFKNNSATIHDVANVVGVSATTIWRALNNKPRVSQATKTRIEDVAKKLNYRPSLVAQTLRTQKTNIIGVMVPMIGDTAYSPIVRAVEQYAFERGYNILLCDTDLNIDREKIYAEQLLRRRVEGTIVIPFAERDSKPFAHLSELQDHGIPVVVAEQDAPCEFSKVVADNFEGAKIMVNHLIGLGHKRIAFIHTGCPEWDYAQCNRLNGYMQTMKENGIFCYQEMAFQGVKFTLDSMHAIEYHDKIIQFIKEKKPTAVFAYCDALALKLMRLLITDMGMKVPDDVAVVGFDDVDMSRSLPIALTTVRPPLDKMGIRAAEILFNQIDNDSKNSEPIYEKLKCELVIRESCGAK